MLGGPQEIDEVESVNKLLYLASQDPQDEDVNCPVPGEREVVDDN